ncbi:MAG TPA: LytTR family DNA-binding domain-containing protein [Thermoanaerobaculia bacterium]|nr:LytTR family DNA-binding domain-containing protein [Thermoanaerobaculia bacterium]
MTERPIRAMIIDDEPLARQRIEDLLRRQEGIEVVGTVDNGEEAPDAIRSLAPDLVFLDVQMPGRSGIEVVAEVGPEAMPATIFVTAYDQFALKAFELAALDYLMKPFDDERFEQTLRRARQAIERRDAGRMARQLVSLLESQSSPAESKYLERLAVETRGQVRVVPVEKIDYITAAGPYAELHIGPGSFAIRERMHTLEQRLDPSRFFRIHRSAIVRIDRIDAFLKKQGGDYAVRLRDGTELSVSRSRREELERLIGVTRG